MSYKHSFAYYYHLISQNKTRARAVSLTGEKYRHKEAVIMKLPVPISLSMSLEKSILGRKSVRIFAPHAMTTKQLSSLLHYSCRAHSIQPPRRTYPSGGALFPIETYVIFGQRVMDKQLVNSICYYNPMDHTLREIRKSSIDTIKSLFLPMNYSIVKNYGCLIILVAHFDRTFKKYKERSYRYALIESGHIAQNIYITSTALNLGCCGIGGYFDNRVNSLLQLNQSHEGTVYILAIGSPSTAN